MTLVWVSAAGALGCVVRYLMEYALRRRHPTQRPWATVAANALGTGLAGWIAYHLVTAADVRLHAILLTGFCGGLTTFSSAFAVPALLQQEHRGSSATLVLVTPLVCTGAFVAGIALAH